MYDFPNWKGLQNNMLWYFCNQGKTCRWLIKLKEEFPTVYPQIIIQDYFILKSLFDNKQLDILISTKEMIAEAHDYIFKKIKNISSYAIIAENSPFAKEKEICFIDLYDTPLTTLHPRFIPF